MAAECRNYLMQVIGLATAEQANAVRDEGLATLDDFTSFDDDDIKILCSSVRKPGGLIPDPNAPAPAVGRGARNQDPVPPAMVANPGFKIPAICESRMKDAAFTAKYYDMIGRRITGDSMSADRIHEFKVLKELQKNHKDPDKLPTISKSFSITKALDALPGYLRERFGCRGVALSYIIRANATPGDVPAQALDSVTSPAYTSIMDELIDFSPHQGPEFNEDNATVLSILKEITKDTTYVSSVTPHVRARNGRAAFLALSQHNMGNTRFQKLVDDAEVMVTQRVWNGKNTRYILKTHIAKHRDAFNDMVLSHQHISYNLPDGRTRVTRLLNSITSNDATVVSAKTQILASPQLEHNFEAAAEFLLKCCNKKLSQNYQAGQGHRISALKTGKRKRDNNCEKGSTGVSLRYHTKKEYIRLKPEQKKELKEWRESQQEVKKQNISAVNTLQEQVQALTQKLSEISRPIADAVQSVKAAKSLLKPKNPLRPPVRFNQRDNDDGEERPDK